MFFNKFLRLVALLMSMTVMLSSFCSCSKKVPVIKDSVSKELQSLAVFDLDEAAMDGRYKATETESAYLKNEKDEFFRLWTMKESYVKMTGEGLRLPLNQFEIRFEERVKIYRDGKTCACFLKEYEIPVGVTELKDGLFMGSGITSISIPSTSAATERRLPLQPPTKLTS